MALIGRIRQNVGLLILLIGIAILSFLLMDVFSGPGSMTGESVSAGSVNGLAVDYNAYQQRVQTTINNQQRTNPNLTDQQRLQAEESAWDSYVKELLAEKEYEQLGVNVTKEEMRNLFVGTNPHPALAAEAAFQNPQTGVFDPELVRTYEANLLDAPSNADQNQIRNQANQWNQFKKFIRQDQQRKKYNNLIKKAIYIPGWMAEQKNAAANKKADINYVMIPYTNVDDASINLSDSDLSSYLNNHMSEYKQEASSDVELISLDIVPSEADKQEALNKITQSISGFASAQNDSAFVRMNSDSPLTGQYYTRNQIPFAQKDAIMNSAIGQVSAAVEEGNTLYSYKVSERVAVADSVNCGHILFRVNPGETDVAARTKMDSVYNLILTGMDFEEAANNNTEDQSGVNKGGDLGWVKPGTMLKQFNDAIFYGGGTGDVVKCRTQAGWHIAKIHEANKTSQAVKVAFITKDVIASTATSNRLYSTANEFSSRNRTIDGFRTAAQEAGYEVKTAPSLSQNEFNVPGIGANNEIAAWAYGADVGEVSKVFIMDDKYVVAAVSNKRKAGNPSVDDVRIQLESKVRNMKKAEQIIAGLGANSDINSIASANNVSVASASGISFDGFSSDLGREPKVQAAATSMAANSTSKPIAGEKGVYVVQVTNITEPTNTDLTSFKSSQANLLRNQVDNGAMEAIKNASEIEDVRYQFRGR